ncbi:lysine histidine transporter-like 8 isoform X2 [Cryptomeria japonica]|uniref:lysine histidine transporter-like 8 isoform X2 n=1 Tax=Cryptomeria japonica TaxID=3369 RepID=UPI0025AD5397|nr:lysine histidine transporter-like 8 isoform X2 [Cryptomeria japonica]
MNSLNWVSSQSQDVCRKAKTEEEEEDSEKSFSLQVPSAAVMEESGGERELVSIPATPMGATPPFTPGAHSPHHQISTSHSHAVTPGQRSPRPSQTPASTRPPSSLVSPSMPRSPLLKTPRTPRTPWTPSLISPRFLSPIGTPMKRVLTNMKSYLEEVGHLTKLNPQDAWLPITESRNGNAYYAAFHNLNAGIGFQALILPVAFTFLGWSWGMVSLTLAYIWQLYTLWVLIRLHEAVPGKRYNRYVELAQAAFGERLGVWLSLFPTVYLSAGTATALILIGGETMKLFFQIVCGPNCGSNPLTTVEWYLVFTSLCIVLSQLPNLNSIAGLSLIGAVTAITYCTMVWGLSISRPRPLGISYDTMKANTETATGFAVLNALGIIAFAFRGHNLAMEIQATMPSSLKHPAYIPMWRGAKVAYVLIAMCVFPIAIGGYWAYGNFMPAGGILNALYAIHNQDISRGLLATTFLLVVFNCLSSFQIYSMPVFDSFEAGYTSRTNKPCPLWVRAGFRVFYGFISFFIGVALPFLSSLAGLLGGLTLPVTFAYPCFMWISIKKPEKYTSSWYLNWGLGILGIVFSLAFSVGGVWSMVDSGLKLKFFKPT